MIQLCKREEAPTALAVKGYECDEVKEAILADQHDKCYLCERRLSTDYEVEHLVSRNGDESKTNEWHNLFIACGYCNARKSNNFDDIPSPDSLPIEDIISQSIDTKGKKAVFAYCGNDASVARLIVLLERLYNGRSGKGRTLMEKRFWNDTSSDWLGFLNRLRDYLCNPTDANRTIVAHDLDVSSTALGFKYSYIKSHAQLWKAFADNCKWNRRKQAN